MTEFGIKIDRLTERLRRGTAQCDLIEQRACLTEERLSTLNDSVQDLSRRIEVSLLMLISSDKERFTWIQLNDSETDPLKNPIVKKFFYRLESYLHRSIIDDEEKLSYIKALSFICKNSVASPQFN